MNFQQLRIVQETARCNFNLTEVANNLFTSQSGVSKHIKDLEDELGVELFIRKGKRLLGMTEPGLEVLMVVERILLDTQNIKNLADHYSMQDKGQLTLATTHTQARYILPPIVAEFRITYPKVKLRMYQGTPQEVAQLLLEGRADIGIATETLGSTDGLVTCPFHSWHHAIIVPAGHALESLSSPTLADIADYPIITYHKGFTGRSMLERTFTAAAIEPSIVLEALDADVIKSYVELGMGVGIIASIAFNPQRDSTLRLIDGSHLFERSTSFLATRKGHLMRKFCHHFIQLCSERMKEDVSPKPGA